MLNLCSVSLHLIPLRQGFSLSAPGARHGARNSEILSSLPLTAHMTTSSVLCGHQNLNSGPKAYTEGSLSHRVISPGLTFLAFFLRSNLPPSSLLASDSFLEQPILSHILHREQWVLETRLQEKILSIWVQYSGFCIHGNSTCRILFENS